MSKHASAILITVTFIEALFLSSLAADTPKASLLLDSLPLRFEANAGQAGSSISYLARGQDYAVGLSPAGSTLELAGSGKRATIRTRFRHAKDNVALTALDPLSGITNYLRGQDRTKWLTNVAAFGRVRYTAVWPGIDLVFYGNGRQLEYDFILQSGASAARIEFDIDGAEGLRVNGQGDLVIATSAGEVSWLKPVVYQNIGGSRKTVRGEYRLKAKNRVGFVVSDYDRTRPLVIDPVLSYSTYVGGASNDSSRSIAVDAAGNAYIAGATTSKNLAVSGSSFQPAYGGESLNFFTGDAFVAKINPAGSALIYLTYLGGSADDAGLGIAIDSSGNAYVTGFTNSTNFPTTAGAFRTTFQGSGGNTLEPGGDAFVTKLNATGTALLYSTYLGGSRDEWGIAIAVDNAGNAYVGGVTLSTNFPVTQGAFQGSLKGGAGNPEFDPSGPLFNGGDAFIAKLNSTGSSLLFATYLGGSKDDILTSIAVDSAGNTYVGGSTQSSDFPTSAGAFQRTLGGIADDVYQPVFKLGDGFIAKFNASGAMVYSTLLGGNRDDGVFGLAVDDTGAVYATGATSSTNFPVTAAAIQKTFKGPLTSTSSAQQVAFFYGDAFVTKLNPAGSALVYSTYLGGLGDDAGWAIRVDGAGSAYISGQTNSADFPVTAAALQKTYGGSGGSSQPIGDAFLAKLNPAGDTVLFATYLGGKRDDTAAGLAIDGAGNVYLTGASASSDFPLTTTPLQKTYGGSGGYAEPYGDAFVTKITDIPGLDSPVSIAAIANGASYATGSVTGGEVITLFGKGIGPATLTLAGFDGPDGTLNTSVAGTRVLFDGVAAPVVYALSTQTSVIVPYDVVGKTATQVVVTVNGLSSPAFSVNVGASQPGLFAINSQGTGQGSIYNQNSSANTAQNPAKPGDIIVLYGTGEGQTNPAGVNGKIANGVYPKIAQPVSITIDGQAATEILYAGAVPGVVAGVFQINVRVPVAITTAGDKKVLVTIGSGNSQDNLTVAIQP